MSERRVSLIVPSILIAVAILSGAGRSCEADFTTIINVPPDPMPTSIGSHTQLNVYEGAMLFHGFEAGAADGSSVDVEVNIYGSIAEPDNTPRLIAYPGSVINMHAPVEGTGYSWITADGSVFNMHGGVIYFFGAGNSTEVNIFEGTIWNMGAHSGSTVNQMGGAVLSDFSGLGGEGSVWNLYDGQIGNRFEMSDGAVMNMYGGQIGYRFSVGDGATMNIFGGTISLGPDTSRDYAFIAQSDSTVNIHGGLFLENILGVEGSRFNLFVRELSLDGVPVPLVPGVQTLIPNSEGVLLEAILADGTFLDLGLGRGRPGIDDFRDGVIFTATLVPEPSTLVLALLAAVGLIAIRSRRRGVDLHASRQTRSWE
ncbi:MAG: PEP-CTERM sorting domain-containing protein [Pirellulales bacterium]